MAMRTQLTTLGVDVAKDWLDIFDGDSTVRIPNSPREIRAFLKQQTGFFSISVEATNVYHERWVELAMAAGHTVYLVDAYRVARYREAIGQRVKTDSVDAQLLFRYLNAEIGRLRPYAPPPKAVKRLMRLLRARAKLAQTKHTLRLSLSDIRELAPTSQALLARIDQAIKLIDGKLISCVRAAGYLADYRRCQTIAGVGPLNAAALVAFYHRADFPNADAWVAFMGLDVRVRESGRFRGRRKLTKQGNPEIRRLLFNAARAGARTGQWNAYYLSLRQRGLSTTAAAVAISRKIVRLAFALMRDQTEYQPSWSENACSGT